MRDLLDLPALCAALPHVTTDGLLRLRDMCRTIATAVDDELHDRLDDARDLVSNLEGALDEDEG